MQERQSPKNDSGSFRDPYGHVMMLDGDDGKKILRVIHETYKPHWDRLQGVMPALLEAQVIPTATPMNAYITGAWKVLQQEEVPFITYPTEWSFDMYKDAALCTLKCQEIALSNGMELQDASAYNIQFIDGKPKMIDITSFVNHEGTAWKAYRQFCEHFLAPIALMSKKDVRLSQLMGTYIDGIPLDLASSLIPKSTFGSMGLGIHIHAHAKMKSVGKAKQAPKVGMRETLGILDSLKTTIKKLKVDQETEWDNYYNETNYTDKGKASKLSIVKEWINGYDHKRIVDLGANDGLFSREAVTQCNVVATDIDTNAVNSMYTNADGNANITSLVLNLASPTPSIGWANTERKSFVDRLGGDNSIMALALTHHLRITYGIPFEKQFSLLACIGKYMIIEYIPRDDSQVEFMMGGRDDAHFTDLSRGEFEHMADEHFKIVKCDNIEDSGRFLYSMERK